VSLLTSSAVTALNKEREVIDLDSVREQERLGYRIKIQSHASSTRQVGLQEVGLLSALLVLSNNLPWQEGGSLSLCPVMARVRFSQQGHNSGLRVVFVADYSCEGSGGISPRFPKTCDVSGCQQ
jgi:hypothetical protein